MRDDRRRSLTRLAMTCLVAVLIVGCASDPAATVAPSAAAPTASSIAAATPALASASPSATPSPSLSRLTGRIVFARRNAAGSFEVFTANADGTGERPLLTGAWELPHWSPDGTHVSLGGAGPDGLVTTTIVGADGSGPRTFKTPSASLNLGCSAWSPDGTRLACEGWDDRDPTRNGVYTVDSTDGGGLTRVTTSPGGGHDIPGSFSPDGSRISFVRSTVADHGSLILVAAKGGKETPLSTIDTFNSAWSPDGRSILADGPAGSLSLVDVASGDVSAIRISTPNGTPRYNFGANWSPDGSRIVFSLVPADASNADIYTMLADGSDLRRVTHDPGQEEFGGWAR